MKTSEIKNKLSEAGVHADTFGKKRNGNFLVRRSFFYTRGFTSDMLAAKVEKAGFEVVDHGEVWKSFRGGASVANQSHWWVEFRAA